MDSHTEKPLITSMLNERLIVYSLDIDLGNFFEKFTSFVILQITINAILCLLLVVLILFMNYYSPNSNIQR